MQLFGDPPKKSKYGDKMANFLKGALRKQIEDELNKAKEEPDIDRSVDAGDKKKSDKAEKRYNELVFNRKFYIVKAFKAMRNLALGEGATVDGWDWRTSVYLQALGDDTMINWTEAQDIWQWGVEDNGSGKVNFSMSLGDNESPSYWQAHDNGHSTISVYIEDHLRSGWHNTAKCAFNENSVNARKARRLNHGHVSTKIENWGDYEPANVTDILKSAMPNGYSSTAGSGWSQPLAGGHNGSITSKGASMPTSNKVLDYYGTYHNFEGIITYGGGRYKC